MKNKLNEKEITRKLQNMPKIVDKTEKQELLFHISNKMNSKEKRTRNSKTWVTVFSIITVAIIALMALPPMLINNEFLSISNKSLDKADYDTMEESTEDYDSGNESEFNNSSGDLAPRMMTDNSESHVAHSQDNEMAIYVGLADTQAQYIVPITLVTDNSNDLSHYYNNIPSYLNEKSWGVRKYPLNGASFEINTNKQEVLLKLPVDFTIDEGSALPYMFERTLMTMFLPYDIDKVLFKTDNDQGVDLGSFGVIKELPLTNHQKASYKVYQLTENNRTFLIPVPHQEEKDIKAAFDEMKKSEEEFHVSYSIPEHIMYTLEPSDHTLIVHFNDNSVLEDVQEYVTMFDAMLMTAKEYEFSAVQFENTMLDYAGPYDLSKPVPVPDIINPVYINE